MFLSTGKTVLFWIVLLVSDGAVSEWSPGYLYITITHKTIRSFPSCLAAARCLWARLLTAFPNKEQSRPCCLPSRDALSSSDVTSPGLARIKTHCEPTQICPPLSLYTREIEEIVESVGSKYSMPEYERNIVPRISNILILLFWYLENIRDSSVQFGTRQVNSVSDWSLSCCADL